MFPRSIPTEVTPESTIKALNNLVKEGALIVNISPVSERCYKDMEMKTSGDATTGILYDFQTTCYTACESDLKVSVISKTEPDPPTGSQQCALSQAFQAVYLPFAYDKNTYMILDPSVVRWFFTSQLTGCDMFVAVDHKLGNRPIVIHSNMQSCGNNIQNLQEKGISVHLMLKSHVDYRLIARWYCEPSPEDKLEADQYLKKYKTTHPGITLISYKLDPQRFHFIGYYVPEQWKFILKGEENGKIEPVFSL